MTSLLSLEPGTQEFIAWFQGSHVADENKAPLLMFHGSRDDIQSFDAQFSHGKLGTYFTSNKIVATSYANRHEHDGYLYQTYLSIKNPYPLSNEENHYLISPMGLEAASRTAFRKRIEEMGFDGLIIQEGEWSYTVSPFYNHQVNVVLKEIVPKL